MALGVSIGYFFLIPEPEDFYTVYGGSNQCIDCDWVDFDDTSPLSQGEE